VELQSHKDHQTWTMDYLPQVKNPIGLKWVFKVKMDANGRLQKYNVRLVAKAFVQEYSIGYKETFFPVARFEIIRVLLSLAAQ
jgi:hypothetical protein